jgi:serine/threonine protein kinase
VKIIDFGIAKAASRITETMPGVIKGKFAYMAPEQLKGITDHRADIFAMGVVLWETLAGVRLFYSGTDVDTLHKVLNLQPPPISLSRREIPEKLDKILERALEKRSGKTLSIGPGIQKGPGRVHCPGHRGRSPLRSGHRSRTG